MASSIFPWATSVEVAEATDTALPLCRDGAWDFVNDCPLFRGGKPLEVTGVEAVKVWAYHALKTDRYCHRIFTTDYGTELARLIGQGYSAETTSAEVKRYIAEALTVYPYIIGVTVGSVTASGDTVSAEITLETIYGGADLNV